MPRARNIKPQFFKNEELVELSFDRRLLFIGLWTLADRDGRMEDRPKRIKMEIFPADDVDVDTALSDLEWRGFIVRYVVDGYGYIQIQNFTKHQNPHQKEAPSTIPAPVETGASPVQAPGHPDTNPADSLIPDSLNPDSLSVGENRKRFVPPTIDEVAEYVREKNYPVDPVRFVAFYESNGWKVGKNKMKCWKSAVTGWSTRNDKPNHSGGGAAAPKQTAAQRIAAKRQQLAAQSPDMGVVATDDGDVWAPLEQSAGRGTQRHLASGNS